MNDLLKLIDELSFLSRETKGASFFIQHAKDSGKFKVVFVNAMNQSKKKLVDKDFESAIKDGIEYLKSERKEVDVIHEKFTLY